MADSTGLTVPKTRTASGIATLWVELARAIKGYRFYPTHHPQLQEIIDRSFRTWRADLNRHGELEAVLHQGVLRISHAAPSAAAHSDELAREFAAHGVSILRVAPALTQDGFRTLLEFFADTDAGASALHKRQKWIQAAAEHGIEIANERAAHAARAAAQITEADPLDLLDASPNFSGRLAGTSGDKLDDADPATLLAELLEPEAFGSMTHESVGPASRTIAPHTARVASATLATARQSLHEQRKADLEAMLGQLEKSDDDATYDCLAAETIATAKLLFEDGDRDAAYQAILTLSAHAAPDAGLGEKRRRCASEALVAFVSGPRLADLIARACTADTSLRIRATQILLQLAEHAVPALLRSIETLQNPDHRSQIAGILIAIGERATPYLLRTMQGNNLQAARVAARIAGEIQNPAAVSTLRKLMTSPDPALSKEASKALVLIGDATAIGALIHALLHEPSAIATQAAYWLGKAQTSHALQPLTEVTQQATLRSDFDLAQEAIRALGHIGLPEAIPTLLFVLEQRSFFKRQQITELKLTALHALANIPGDEAKNWLEKFAEGEDPVLKREARRAFIKRAQGHATP